jgi:hypothetical protein
MGRLPEDSIQHASIMGRSYPRQDFWQEEEGPDLEWHRRCPRCWRDACRPRSSWIVSLFSHSPDFADAPSGCSTMLKTIAGEMNGIYLEEESELNYRGITPKQMLSQFRGEAIYTAENDVHFPKLTVGDTLS